MKLKNWKKNKNGKFDVPCELQQQFYKVADDQMEKLLVKGLLTNRFSIRSFAIDMLSVGYKIRMDEESLIQSAPSAQQEAQAKNILNEPAAE